jgi:thiol-disulfide isomerase/thioredoxin
MKKYFGIFILIGVLLLSGCTNNATKFKKDYESLNEVERNGKMNRTVTIDKDNPYVFITGEEIVKKIENKETFYLYVGDKMCPWCRSVIEMATKKAKEYNVKTIYYINIWDDDHNEVFRDKYELKEDGSLEKTVEGTEGYKKLLTYFDSVLSDYTLTDSNNNKIETGEKRIYAPNFFYVKDGEVKVMVEGISDKLTDPRGELTEEILKDEADIFEGFFKTNVECSDKC